MEWEFIFGIGYFSWKFEKIFIMLKLHKKISMNLLTFFYKTHTKNPSIHRSQFALFKFYKLPKKKTFFSIYLMSIFQTLLHEKISLFSTCNPIKNLNSFRLLFFCLLYFLQVYADGYSPREVEFMVVRWNGQKNFYDFFQHCIKFTTVQSYFVGWSAPNIVECHFNSSKGTSTISTNLLLLSLGCLYFMRRYKNVEFKSFGLNIATRLKILF